MHKQLYFIYPDRNKRDESSISGVQYKSEDIIIFDGYPKRLGDNWLVQFVVVQHSGIQRSKKTFALDKMTVRKAILQNKGAVEGVLGAKIVRVDAHPDTVPETHSVEDSKTALAVIAAGTVAAIVCVVIAIAATFFIR